jgi:nitrite reductase (NADH) large subunit
MQKVLSFLTRKEIFTGSFFFDESSIIIGATLIKDTNDAGLYYNLVKTRTKINTFHNLNQFANYAKFLRSINYR